jgi:hypothetical protein
MYKTEVTTGEVYKTGLKKGQLKTRKEFRYDGVRYTLDWALQLNAYRLMVQDAGFDVKRMVIQAMCRDSGSHIVAERGIDRPIYLIPVYRISDNWLKCYFTVKAHNLQVAFSRKTLPAVCKPRERWHDRRCLDYCVVSEYCPHGCAIKQRQQKCAG